MRRSFASTPLPQKADRKFATLQELQEYFNNDKLTCLVCGERFVQLVAHIAPSHNLSADEYRDRFGIPWTYGLAGRAFRERSSLRMQELKKRGKVALVPSPDHITRLAAAARRRRSIVEALKNDSRQKLLVLHGRETKWEAKDFEEYLHRIALCRTPREVGEDDDMPTYGSFRKYLRRNADFAERFYRTWERLPYSLLVRTRKLGHDFARDVVELRHRNMTWREVAAVLGVTASTARDTWHRLKKKGILAEVEPVCSSRMTTSSEREILLSSTTRIRANTRLPRSSS